MLYKRILGLSQALLMIVIAGHIGTSNADTHTATQYLQTNSTSINETRLHIINTSSTTQQFVGTLYNGNGDRLGAASTSLGESIAPDARLILDSPAIESLFGVEPWSGPAMLEISAEGAFELMAKLVSPSGLISNTNCVREDRVLNIEGFDSDSVTYVRFINTTDATMSSIKGSLYDENGNTIGNAETTMLQELGPKEQVWINRNDFADLLGEQWDGTAMLEVDSVAGLKLLNLNFINGETFFNFSCFENSTLGTVYLQTTSSSENISFTHIVNTADIAQRFTGTLFNGDGDQLGLADIPLQVDEVPAKGRLILSSENLEEAFSVEPWSGPATLLVEGSSTFEQMTRLTSPSGLVSNTNCVRREKVHNIEGGDSTDVTYVRFINAGLVTLSDIRGTLINASGEVIGNRDQVFVDTLSSHEAVWRSRDQLETILGTTWQGEASLTITEAPASLRMLNLNFIDNETFFNFSCYESSVTQANNTPEFTSSATVSIAENIENTGYVSSATDVENDEIIFELTGNGDDDHLFSVDPLSGQLSFLAPPDFEIPTDTGADNLYSVELIATDGVTSQTQIVSVTVTDDDSEVIIAESLGLTDINLRSTNAGSTADFYTPEPMSTRLEESLSVSSAVSNTELSNRMRFSFGPATTTDLFVLSDTSDAISESLISSTGLAAETSITGDLALRSLFQFFEMDNGSFAIFSVKHPNYALDQGDNNELVLRDVRSLSAFEIGTASMLTFSADAGESLFVADGRYTIDSQNSGAPSTDERGTIVYTQDSDWDDRRISISEGVPGLSTSGGALIAVYAPSIDLDIPTDFNPEAISFVSNVEYYPGTDNENLFTAGIKNIDSAYAAQVTTPGLDTDTTEAAVAMLEGIESTLASQGSQMRYPQAFYLALRSGLLSRRSQSAEGLDVPLNQLTVPYVYFTNEQDDSGDYHPFMVIATHGIPDSLALLRDVNRPPGDGLDGNYESQYVTRSFYLENFLLKLPLRDYGEVATLEENDLDFASSGIGSLAEDANETGFNHHNYASRGSSALSVDGVVIYPSYNNTLVHAQEAAELSARGMHAGRGLGVHYHADAHSAAVTSGIQDLNFYGASDYSYHRHPPITSISFDGVAGYGFYQIDDSTTDGVLIALDDFGGHEHGDYGYHYHSQITDNALTVRESVNYTIHELGPLGAWSGRINFIPEFTISNRSRYHGNE